MKPLPPGGTIGVAAPASPYDSRSDVLRGVEWWESQGYRVKLGEQRLRPRRLRRRASRGSRRRPERALRRPRGRRRPGAAGRLRLGADDPAPRLRGDRRATRSRSSASPTSRRCTSRSRQRTGHADLLRQRPRRRRRPPSRPSSRASGCSQVLTGDAPAEVPREPRRPVRARDPRRDGHGAARRRLPLAAHADDGHPLGARARWLDPLLRGLQGAAVLRRRDAHPAASRGEARRASLASSSARWRAATGATSAQASDWARSRSLEDVLEEHLEPLGVPLLYRLPLGHGKHLAALPLGVRYTLDADSRVRSTRRRVAVLRRERHRRADDEEVAWRCSRTRDLGRRVLVGFATKASGSGASAKAGARSGSGTSSRIDSLNPYVAFNQDAYSTFVYVYPFPGPVRQDEHASSSPTSPTSWKPTDGGRTWTFQTLSNAKWSDGQAADCRGRSLDDQHRPQVRRARGAANTAGPHRAHQERLGAQPEHARRR